MTNDIHVNMLDRIPGILTSTPVKKLKNKNPAVPTTTESTMDTTPLMEGDDLGEVIERPI